MTELVVGMPRRSGTAPGRSAALRRFALAITVFTLLGQTAFGFEQSWLQILVALGAAYGTETLLEWTSARSTGRRARFRGGWEARADFLLSAHITGLAVSMLLYANDRLMPIIFATVVAIGSKSIFRTTVGGRNRHFFNPSNLGITLTLLVFPWVGIAPAYHFTENLVGWMDWLLPALIVVSGSALNARYTQRIPLILAWVFGFFTQALLRAAFFGGSLWPSMLPMSGVAFILFTFYMVTDPATTPSGKRGQVVFGFAVAGAYGLLMVAHIVFGLFFALSIVCVCRGLFLTARAAVPSVKGSSVFRWPRLAPVPTGPEFGAQHVATLAEREQ